MLQFNKKKVLFSVISFFFVVLLISIIFGKGVIEGRQPTLYSFSIINFAGYLFFLMLPVEILIPYYLSIGYSGVVLIILALITAMIAQMLDYSVGFSVSEPFIHDVIGKWRYQRAEKIINKYGSVAIFFFNFLPISSPIIVLAAGFLRVDFKKVLFYSFIGLLAKYSLIVILFRFIF